MINDDNNWPFRYQFFIDILRRRITAQQHTCKREQKRLPRQIRRGSIKYSLSHSQVDFMVFTNNKNVSVTQSCKAALRCSLTDLSALKCCVCLCKSSFKTLQRETPILSDNPITRGYSAKFYTERPNAE